jgi:hypothetical protein
MSADAGDADKTLTATQSAERMIIPAPTKLSIGGTVSKIKYSRARE